MTDRQSVSHVLRRLTFGPTASEVDRAAKVGVEATVAAVLAPQAAPPGAALGADPLAVLPKDADRDARLKARAEASEQTAELGRWWLRQMSASGSAAEKLTFFWHGHWATSVQKVKSANLMYQQQQTFRRYGTGDTGPFVRAMLRDPALMLWLDGQKNTAKAPNENLARELMELFTLGVGKYTENDVRAGARVLTGWSVDRGTGTAKLTPKRQDRAPVTRLGRTGAIDVDGYADLLVRHEAHAPFLARGSGCGTAPGPRRRRRRAGGWSPRSGRAGT